jgi:hypothetical protein
MMTLPAELLELVFLQLSPRDLKAAVVVCRRWREAGEAPGLWAGACFRVNTGNLASMPEVLAIKKFRQVKRLAARRVSEDLFEAAALHPGLRAVDLWNADLSLVETDLLTRALGNMEELNLVMTDLTRQQLEAIFTHMSVEGSKMKRLKLILINLSRVSPRLFARAVSSMERVSMSVCAPTMEASVKCLTMPQLKELLTAIHGGCRLRNLTLEDSYTYSFGILEKLDAGLVARAFNKMEEVTLNGHHLSREQVARILEQSLVATSLNQLNIGHGSLKGLDQSLVSRARQAIGRLE